MGLLTSQIRLMYLQQQRLDLEYKIQLITQTKMGLSQSVSDLMQVGNDYDPESPTTKLLHHTLTRIVLCINHFQSILIFLHLHI